jgi:hypothetical protein
MRITLCPVLHIATQGDTIEEARLNNLIETDSLFLLPAINAYTENLLKECQ